MKNLIRTLLCGLLAVSLIASCDTTSNDDDGIKSYDLEVSLNFDNIDTDTYSLEDMYSLEVVLESSNGTQTELIYEDITDSYMCEALTAGSYSISATGKLSETVFVVGTASVELYSDQQAIITFDSQTVSSLVFKTIYHSSVGYYITDCFTEIVNNSDEVQYLDQIIITAHMTANQTVANAWQSIDILDRYNAGQGYVIAFPGEGTDYPLEPGASVVISNTATTHVSGSYSLPDLKDAAFEIYNVDGSGGDIDYDATNMEIIFANNIGLKGFGFGINGGALTLSRCPSGMTPAEYAADPDNSMTTPNTTSETLYLMIDSQNILDAVYILPSTNTTRYPFFLAKDEAGAATAATSWSGLCVTRKSEVVDGVTKYIDTNNSTNDFETDQANPYI